MSVFAIITIYALGNIQGLIIAIAVILFEEKKNQPGE